MNRAAPAEARPLLEALLAAAGPTVRSVLLFGSRLVRSDPDDHSAWDVVVVVDDYRAFHRRLVAGGHHRRPAWLLSLLARVLPPNITAFDPGGGESLAKCAIVSETHFVRALGPAAPDHFLKGRMVQTVAVLWSADAEAERTVTRALETARRDVLRWVGPYLGDHPEGFTPAELGRRLLTISYDGELRPERGDRVEQVFDAQRAYLTETYRRVLDEAAERGEVVALGEDRYRLARPPAAGRRSALKLYFARSKVRSTMRWLKHVATFNDWLTYIERKVERRTGMAVDITPWERRLPLLLLWPKVVRVLRHRHGASGEDLP